MTVGHISNSFTETNTSLLLVATNIQGLLAFCHQVKKHPERET